MTSVSSVSNNLYMKDAIKYINGISLTEAGILDDVGNAFCSVPGFVATQGGLFAGGRLLSNTNEKVLTQTGEEALTIFGNPKYKKAGIKGLTGALSDIKDLMIGNEELNAILKSNKGLKNAGVNLEITKNIKDAIKAGKASEVSNIISKAASSDELLEGLTKLTGASSESAKNASIISKITNAIKTSSLGTKILNSNFVTTVKGVTEGASKTAVGGFVKNGLGKVSKALKGSCAGFNLAIEGVMALFQDVIPAFKQGGATEGVKQVAKSAVKVGASTAGWVLGSKAGSAVGSAIGTAICPGVGTFIGGFVGDLVGGLIGSSITAKVTEKIIGKGYTEQLQDEAINEQSMIVSQNSSYGQQVNQAVYQLIQEDMADDGKLTKDSEKMLTYLQNGADEANVSNTSTLSQSSTLNQPSTSLDYLIQRINTGDTSVYDVPADVLSAAANAYSTMDTTDYANNYTNFGMTNPYLKDSSEQEQGQVFNYFSA